MNLTIPKHPKWRHIANICTKFTSCYSRHSRAQFMTLLDLFPYLTKRIINYERISSFGRLFALNRMVLSFHSNLDSIFSLTRFSNEFTSHFLLAETSGQSENKAWWSYVLSQFPGIRDYFNTLRMFRL